MPSRFGRRFDDLWTEAEALGASKTRQTSTMLGEGDYIDNNTFLNWKVKVRHLLSMVPGENSQHFKQFVESEKAGMYATNYEIFLRLKAVLLAAKQDYEGGYLNTFKHLVQAELFDSELEQAQELLACGYASAAAVIAGAVMETTLREMCADNSLTIGNMNKMNADLAKAGVYNKLTAKQITSIADIRNNAAHGNKDQFSKKDVEGMIRDIQRILAERGV